MSESSVLAAPRKRRRFTAEFDAGAIKVIREYDDSVVSRVSGLTRLDADVGHSTGWQRDTGGGVAGEDSPGVLINGDRGFYGPVSFAMSAGRRHSS